MYTSSRSCTRTVTQEITQEYGKHHEDRNTIKVQKSSATRIRTSQNFCREYRYSRTTRNRTTSELLLKVKVTNKIDVERNNNSSERKRGGCILQSLVLWKEHICEQCVSKPGKRITENIGMMGQRVQQHLAA